MGCDCGLALPSNSQILVVPPAAGDDALLTRALTERLESKLVRLDVARRARTPPLSIEWTESGGSSPVAIAELGGLQDARGELAAVILGDSNVGASQAAASAGGDAVGDAVGEYAWTEWYGALLGLFAEAACVVVNRPVAAWHPSARGALASHAVRECGELEIPQRVVTTKLGTALGFAASCAYDVLVAVDVRTDNYAAPGQSDLAAMVESVLARRSVVTLVQRYTGRPWLAVVAGDAIVAGRGAAMWSPDDALAERSGLAYEDAELPIAVDRAVRALARRLHCELLDIRLVELAGSEGWLCYSVGVWPRFAAAPWAAGPVADHLLAFLRDRGARW